MLEVFVGWFFERGGFGSALDALEMLKVMKDIDQSDQQQPLALSGQQQVP